MNDILLQAIIFVLLVLQGAITRFSYVPTVFFQKRVNSKAFTFVTDIMTALIGAAGMMLTCFLLAGEVRIFYALFFLGGITLAHLILKNFKSTERKAETSRKRIAEAEEKPRKGLRGILSKLIGRKKPEKSVSKKLKGKTAPV